MFHLHHGDEFNPLASEPDLSACVDPFAGASHCFPTDGPDPHGPRFGDGGSYEGNGVWRDEFGHLHEGGPFGPRGGWDLISS